MFYFLHIGKCAGTSFVNLASRNVAVFRPSTNGNPRNPLTGRMLHFWQWPAVEQEYFLSSGSWQFVANETCLGRTHRFFAGVTYVVILREPLDRLFSTYQYLRAKPDTTVPLAERGQMFAHFLSEERAPHWRRNKLVGSLTDKGRKRAAERIEMAKRRLAQFDHIFFVETLAEDVRILGNYGWEQLEVPWRNARAPGEPTRSAARAALERYPELVAQLTQQNAEDIELYRYACQLTESRRSVAPALERILPSSARPLPESDNFDFLVCCAYEFHLKGEESRCLDVLRTVERLPAAAAFGLSGRDSFADVALQRFCDPAAAMRLHQRLREQRKQERPSRA